MDHDQNWKSFQISTAVVTGAAGFTGAVLVEQLRKLNINVYAIVRPGSVHNSRISDTDKGIRMIEAFPEDYGTLSKKTECKADVFFHLAWTGDRDVIGQMKSVDYTLAALEAAAELGCKRFICTGSQAEYGIVPPDEATSEDRAVNPITAYGAAKVAACQLSKIRAKELDIDWIWGRIFSLIGKYEPRGRMLPDLYDALKEGREMSLSSCRQNWDYLDVYDAADALIALAQHGNSGEIYNIANGNYKPLKEYTEKLRGLEAPDVSIRYGADPEPLISLQPTIGKIKADTGWQPQRAFEESIRDYEGV